MEDIITEKFALLNLIKALQGISAVNPDNKDGESSAPPPAYSAPDRKQSTAEYNAMADVLRRHEAISNRVRNKR